DAEAMSAARRAVLSPLPADGIRRERRKVRAGDPDQGILENEEDVGNDRPGRTTPAPDPNEVDEVGRAWGVQEEDSGALRSSSEIMASRDHHRSELIGAPEFEGWPGLASPRAPCARA